MKRQKQWKIVKPSAPKKWLRPLAEGDRLREVPTIRLRTVLQR